MADTIIGGDCPGADWECQCARCGSSIDRERCDQCEDGFDGHDCGEDCCFCLDPESNLPCQVCHGEGGWWECCSSPEWCDAHPLPGREHIGRATPEWFRVSPSQESPT